MSRAVVIATAWDLLTGVTVTALIVGAYLFHRAGMARVHRGGTHVARLRPGMRNLTPEEARELVARQRALEDASEAWLSEQHRQARAQLCGYVAALADDQVPLSQIGDAMGVRKQRAHQQAQAGRELVTP